MILVSHRGNLTGKEPDRENSPNFITEAIEKGFYVEVDVWVKDGNHVFLGHDGPQYPVSIEFLKNKKIICHCKNIEALRLMLDNNIHCFFHKTDDVTLTSKGYIWTFPKKKLVPGSFCVMPEYGYTGDISSCMGICSDFIQDYK